MWRHRGPIPDKCLQRCRSGKGVSWIRALARRLFVEPRELTLNWVHRVRSFDRIFKSHAHDRSVGGGRGAVVIAVIRVVQMRKWRPRGKWSHLPMEGIGLRFVWQGQPSSAREPAPILTAPNWELLWVTRGISEGESSSFKANLAYLTVNPRHNEDFIHKYFSFYSID